MTGHDTSRWPSIPVIVTPATSAFTMASSTDSTVPRNKGVIAPFGSIVRAASDSLFPAPRFAVDKATKRSPEPLFELPPWVAPAPPDPRRTLNSRNTTG